MKLKFTNGTVTTARGDVGSLFIAAGLAVEVFDPPPARRGVTIWQVGEFQSQQGGVYIGARCESCDARHAASGAAAPTTRFFHCVAGGELPPQDIVNEFREAPHKIREARRKNIEEFDARG